MAVRSLSCPHCGAPLRWKGDARVIECAYCKTHIVADTRTVTFEPSHTVATKPPKVIPALIIGLILTFVVSLGIFLASGGANPARGGLAKWKPAQIRSLELNLTADQFAKKHGGVIRSGCVFRHFDDATWGDINFCWDPPDSPHATSVNINPAKQDPKNAFSETLSVPEVALQRAQAVFGHQLVKNVTSGYAYYAHGTSLNIGSSLSISDQKKPGWEKRVDVLWRLMRHLVLGDPFRVGADEQAALNIGYTLDGLAKIDAKLPVKQAEAEIKRVYPGVEAEAPRFDVGLEHPWFQTATIYWNNTVEGGLDRFVLSYHARTDFVPYQKRLEACITPVAGKPQITVTDPLKDIKNYFWSAKGKPTITVSHQTLVYWWRQGEFDAKLHSTILQAIARCK